MTTPAPDPRTRIAAASAAQHVSEYQGGVHPEDVLRLTDAAIHELDEPNTNPPDYGPICSLCSANWDCTLGYCPTCDNETEPVREPT